MTVNRTSVIAGIAALVAVIAVFAFTGNRTTETGNLAAVTAAFDGAANAQESEAASEIPDMVLGDADAPITVVEYASFTCPHCGRFHTDVYPEIKENFIETGKVKFVLREVFFDKYGLWASMLARCAGPDRYFGVADLLLSNQSDWVSRDDAAVAESLYRIGRQAGMDDETMQACLQNGEQAQALVAYYQENATADGVNSTPTFIIDCESHGNMSYSDFETLLNDKLN